MPDLTFRRVRVLEPTLFYPRVDRCWSLHGNAVRGYPPVGGTILKCASKSVLVRADFALPGESSHRVAWIRLENVAVITPDPKEI